MENNKIITYHIDAGDGELITVDLLGGLEYEGCLQKQIEDMINLDEMDEEGELFSFTVTVKKVLTEQEVMDLPEKF